LKRALDAVEGMRFDRGYLSSNFATDPNSLEAERTPRTRDSDTRKENIPHAQLLPLLEQVAQGPPAGIIAEDVGRRRARPTLVLFSELKMRGILKVVANQKHRMCVWRASSQMRYSKTLPPSLTRRSWFMPSEELVGIQTGKRFKTRRSCAGRERLMSSMKGQYKQLVGGAAGNKARFCRGRNRDSSAVRLRKRHTDVLDREEKLRVKRLRQTRSGVAVIKVGAVRLRQR
jgi:hypothetical protein